VLGSFHIQRANALFTDRLLCWLSIDVHAVSPSLISTSVGSLKMGASINSVNPMMNQFQPTPKAKFHSDYDVYRGPTPLRRCRLFTLRRNDGMTTGVRHVPQRPVAPETTRFALNGFYLATHGCHFTYFWMWPHKQQKATVAQNGQPFKCNSNPLEC
jgi:hypothetical protein